MKKMMIRGGLCANFSIDGFRFDKFVHFSFTDDSYIKGLFQASSPLYEHPIAYAIITIKALGLNTQRKIT
ncbi:hypothetical protein V2I21_03370 [Campylobacter sp. CLAX-22107-21]|uniref:hypothetical protein n=1 Tax=Campylobacter devanensis TaxID=3161138 RepID=UPI002E9EFFC7|nr:hypothetical protein [Campylobacter sp. CLAX-22107-21]